MKKLVFFFFLLGIISCGESEKTNVASTYTSYITGLASPVRLKLDSTTIILRDYFPNVSGIEHVEYAGVVLHPDSNGSLLITQNPPAIISNLNIVYKGVKHDIPVFASDKVKFKFSYKPTSSSIVTVEMSGNMNGWNRKATPLKREGDVFTTELILNTGLYQYRIWEDGKEMMDQNNSEKISNGMGAFNNTFFAGTKKEEAPKLISSVTKPGVVEVNTTGAISNIIVYFENKQVDVMRNGSTLQIPIPEEAKQMKRSHIRIFASDYAQRSNDVLIPLQYGEAITEAGQLDRKDLQATVMYFMMVDRFVNGTTTNDRPTNDPAILPKANNFGGDIQGITQKIRDGYFKSLGINTVWVSPISQNAVGAWGLWNKGIESKFSAYHGYWPTGLKKIDDRFGNEEAFKELIAVAHENNMNVILDYVAHHVHQDHALYKEKPDWTTPLFLPDGTMNTEKWDEHRLTTWFDTFLPTWNFANHEVVEALTDTAMYWVENYDLDGFRHDATKHINEDFWRTLTLKVKNYTSQHPERKIYQVGETYGSPELISSYINSGEMDAQFDFNLYDAAVDAFAKNETDFKNLERVMKESLDYYGSHHLMGNITGNQDRARFISYADGSIQFSEDAKLMGWTKEIENKSDIGFEKLAMLNAFLMTSPGIPCIYYGDEIGMPGGNDPDNRRMMHFGDWNESQQKLHDITSKLVHLRRNNMALSYGDIFILKNDADALVYVRSYFGKNVITVFEKNKSTHGEWILEVPKEFRIEKPASITNSGGYVYDDGKIKSVKNPTEYSLEVFY